MTWLFDAEHMTNILGSVVADAGKSSADAETEEVAHVTYSLMAARKRHSPVRTVS